MAEMNNINEELKDENPILLQLLQVWQDYYDEIFEVDQKTGRFESLMNEEGRSKRWAQSGFAGIEIIILAEKYIHPDDKEAFREFFDLEGIKRRVKENIYVTKLNFRMLNHEGGYSWVKVKNIVPTKQIGDHIKFFACFRKVEDETGADLKYKQELIDALDHERTQSIEKSKVIAKIAEEIRSPLASVIGMAALAKTETSDPAVSRERFKMIEAEAVKMNRVLRKALPEAVVEELPDFEFEDRPINRISYGKRHEEDNKVSISIVDSSDIPKDFAFSSGEHDISSERDPEDTAFEENVSGEEVLRGRKILLAESNKLTCEVMRHNFEKLGAQLCVVSDGKAAVIEFVSKPAGTYDLVFLDTKLTELDGFSAARCIRIAGKDDSETVPIIATAAGATTDDIKKAYRFGFSCLFSQPINHEKLFVKIKEFLYGVH